LTVLHIHNPKFEVQILEINLRSCLTVLEPFVSCFDWKISTVYNAMNQELYFEVTGDLEPIFQTLLTSDQFISKHELDLSSQLTHQLIWVELRGFESITAIEPTVFIRAIDSTFFEIETENPEIIERVKQCFKNVGLHEHRWGTMRSLIPQSNG